MQKTMYKTLWHYDSQGELTHCLVNEVTVNTSLQEDITIIVGGVTHTISGELEDYYETPAAAWKAIDKALQEWVVDSELQIKTLQKRIRKLEFYRSKLQSVEE